MNPKVQGAIPKTPVYSAVFFYSFNHLFTYKYLLSGKCHDLSDALFIFTLK